MDIVALWSASMAVGLADSAGAVRPGFTVTETMLDMTSSEGEPLSVTCSSKDHEPVVDNWPVDIVGLSLALHENEVPRLPKPESDGPFFIHWQLYGEEPPLNELVVERTDDWPESIVVGMTETTGAMRAGLTAMTAALEVTVAGDAELSVT